jgi:hypothetical protein
MFLEFHASHSPAYNLGTKPAETWAKTIEFAQNASKLRRKDPEAYRLAQMGLFLEFAGTAAGIFGTAAMIPKPTAAVKNVGSYSLFEGVPNATKSGTGGFRGLQSIEMTHWQNYQAERLLHQAKQGRRLSTSEVEQFRKYLDTYHNADLLVEGIDKIPSNIIDYSAVGGFAIGPSGRPVIVLRKEATGYTALHEYLHLRHYEKVAARNVGQEIAAWEAISVREVEQVVYDELRFRYWRHLSPGQQHHAREYVLDKGGFSWD